MYDLITKKAKLSKLINLQQRKVAALHYSEEENVEGELKREKQKLQELKEERARMGEPGYAG